MAQLKVKRIIVLLQQWQTPTREQFNDAIAAAPDKQTKNLLQMLALQSARVAGLTRRIDSIRSITNHGLSQ